MPSIISAASACSRGRPFLASRKSKKKPHYQAKCPSVALHGEPATSNPLVFAVNLTTATALGLTVPPDLLAAADKVVQ
jgi:hypothetical protein